MKRIIAATVPFVLISMSACTIASQSSIDTQHGFEALKNKDYATAETDLNAALASDPNNAYAILDLGVVYQNTGRIAQARANYQKVIDLNPTAVATQTTNAQNGASLVDMAKADLAALPPQ